MAYMGEAPCSYESPFIYKMTDKLLKAATPANMINIDIISEWRPATCDEY